MDATTDTTKPSTQRDALIKRQSDLADKVQGLRAERSAAALRGEPMSASALRDAQDDLEAITEAIADFDKIAARQAAAAEKKALIAADTALRKNINKLSGERMSAIADAEKAARAFVGAYDRAEKSRASLAAALRGISGNLPIELSEVSQRDRLSRGLSAVLQHYLKDFRFGEMKLRPGHREDNPCCCWADFEKTALEHIELLINEGGANDQAS
jgi:hypothetical protein